jgi:hypothetical protein
LNLSRKIQDLARRREVLLKLQALISGHQNGEAFRPRLATSADFRRTRGAAADFSFDEYNRDSIQRTGSQ